MTLNSDQTFGSYLSSHFNDLNEAPSLESCRFYEEAIGSDLPNNSDAAILEIGIGRGHFALFATNMRNFTNYWGIDISKECVDEVRSSITNRVEQVADSLDWLKEHAQEFDCIVAIDVIEHVVKQDQLNFLKILRASLKPSGTLILRTDNTAILTGFFQHSMDFTHEYTFSERSLRQIALLAGFNKIKLHGDPRRPITGIKSLLRLALTVAWRRILLLIYEIERPDCKHPRILTKNIYAICRSKA